MTESTKESINRIHQFQRFGSILGLERMNSLLDILGNPQDQLRVIHVAGTNGKGSVCRYIYSVLQEAGFRTGLYTSPYIETFNERIEYDGNCISDGDLDKCTGKVLAAVDVMLARGEQSPTEFEVVTAIAFIYFKEKNCDYVVLEVGLGGRGDSTNVCKAPLMTIITSVSMDHMDRLGDTIEEIAGEKAGIIKPGCPVMTSADNPAAVKVIEKRAAETGSPVFNSSKLTLNVKKESLYGSIFSLLIEDKEFKDIRISMAGRHQIENAAAAVYALFILQKRNAVTISNEALYAGLAKARQKGRLEIFNESGGADIVLDGAHNEGGAKALAEAVRILSPDSKVLMVTGMLADKDTKSVIGEFIKIASDFIVTEPLSPRRMEAGLLAEQIEATGGRCRIEADVDRAFGMAIERKKDFDLILFAGSLYMIGRIRSLLTGTGGKDD